MKSFIKTTLFLFAVLLSTAASANESHEDYDFKVDGIYYKIIDNEASVTFQGYYLLSDYNYFYYSDYSGDIVIPETVTYDGITYPVTVIGDYAFWFSEITNIVIPNSIKEIGEGAFGHCNSLTSIEIPKSVLMIWYRPFEGCNNLTNIVVAEDNPVYDSRDNCNAIIMSECNTLYAGCKNTCIPNTVTDIGPQAFLRCTSLYEIEIPSSVTTIWSSAFRDCTILSHIEIPNSVTSIGEEAFEGCESLTNFIIPNSVSSIEREAFKDCKSLTNIVIPNSITRIEDETFYGCWSLTSVTIGNSVEYIDEFAFNMCNSLSIVKCLALNPPSIYHNTFDYDDFFENASLEVPPVAIEAYQNHEYWGKFFSIQPIIVPGDMDGNGLIGISDVAGLIDLVLAGDTPVSVADLNGDGQVSVADIAELIDQLFADGGN